jgi:hypothetical protein
VSTAKDVVDAALALVGRKFLHQGRGGLIDCVGLLVCVGLRVGSPLQDFTNYAPSPDPLLLRDQLDAQLDRSDALDCPLGCVLGFCRIGEGLQHVGVLVARDPFKMVHVTFDRGCVADPIDARMMQHRHDSWLFRGVQY